MKRFLLIFCTAVLAVAMLVIPACADNAIVGNISNNWCYFDVAAGEYSLHVYTDSTRQEMLLNIPTFNISEGTHTITYEGLDSICYEATVQIVYDGDQLKCGITALGEFENGSIYVFSSTKYPDVVAELVPIPRKVGFLESVGDFFTSCMSMLASVALVVVSSPALIIMTVAVVILGFIYAQLKRMKN